MALASYPNRVISAGRYNPAGGGGAGMYGGGGMPGMGGGGGQMNPWARLQGQGMQPGGQAVAPQAGGASQGVNTQSGMGSQPPNFAGSPYGPQGQGLGQALTQNYQTGAGLQDPNSDYYKRLSSAMLGQIGEQTAAGNRAAALRNAWNGGGGSELSQMQGMNAQSGNIAGGNAQANLAMQAPIAGAGIVQGTYGPALGMQNLANQQYQFGQGMAFDQQQAANQQAQFQAQLQQQANLQQQQLQMQQYLAQLNGSLGYM